MQMDWSDIELVVYATSVKKVNGLICLPSDNILHHLSLEKRGNSFQLVSDELAGKVKWKIRAFNK